MYWTTCNSRFTLNNMFNDFVYYFSFRFVCLSFYTIGVCCKEVKWLRKMSVSTSSRLCRNCFFFRLFKSSTYTTYLFDTIIRSGDSSIIKSFVRALSFFYEICTRKPYAALHSYPPVNYNTWRGSWCSASIPSELQNKVLHKQQDHRKKTTSRR